METLELLVVFYTGLGVIQSLFHTNPLRVRGKGFSLLTKLPIKLLGTKSVTKEFPNTFVTWYLSTIFVTMVPISHSKHTNYFFRFTSSLFKRDGIKCYRFHPFYRQWFQTSVRDGATKHDFCISIFNFIYMMTQTRCDMFPKKDYPINWWRLKAIPCIISDTQLELLDMSLFQYIWCIKQIVWPQLKKGKS